MTFARECCRAAARKPRFPCAGAGDLSSLPTVWNLPRPQQRLHPWRPPPHPWDLCRPCRRHRRHCGPTSPTRGRTTCSDSSAPSSRSHQTRARTHAGSAGGAMSLGFGRPRRPGCEPSQAWGWQSSASSYYLPLIQPPATIRDGAECVGVGMGGAAGAGAGGRGRPHVVVIADGRGRLLSWSCPLLAPAVASAAGWISALRQRRRGKELELRTAPARLRGRSLRRRGFPTRPRPCPAGATAGSWTHFAAHQTLTG